MISKRMFSFELQYQIPPRYFFVSLQYGKDIENAKDELDEHRSQVRLLMEDRKVLMKGEYKDNSGKSRYH